MTCTRRGRQPEAWGLADLTDLFRQIIDTFQGFSDKSPNFFWILSSQGRKTGEGKTACHCCSDLSQERDLGVRARLHYPVNPGPNLGLNQSVVYTEKALIWF